MSYPTSMNFLGVSKKEASLLAAMVVKKK